MSVDVFLFWGETKGSVRLVVLFFEKLFCAGDKMLLAAAGPEGCNF